MSKTKLHTRYYNHSGQLVPGVTTIIGDTLGWNKNILMAWQKKTLLAGEDPDKVRDKAADIGTIAHYLIECHLAGTEPDLTDYAIKDIDQARKCLSAYLDWASANHVEMLQSEAKLVSEEYQYGGTADKIAYINGVLGLMDFKTSRDVYPEMRVQIAAYGAAWRESFPDMPIQEYHILRISKEDASFQHHRYSDLTAAFEVFCHLREIYRLRSSV